MAALRIVQYEVGALNRLVLQGKNAHDHAHHERRINMILFIRTVWSFSVNCMLP